MARRRRRPNLLESFFHDRIDCCRLGTNGALTPHTCNKMPPAPIYIVKNSHQLPVQGRIVKKMVYRPIRSIEVNPKPTDLCLGMTPQEFEMLESKRHHGNPWVNAVCALLDKWESKQIDVELERLAWNDASWSFSKEDLNKLATLPGFTNPVFYKEKLRAIECKLHRELVPAASSTVDRVVQFVDAAHPEQGFTIPNYVDPFSRHWDLVCTPKNS